VNAVKQHKGSANQRTGLVPSVENMASPTKTPYIVIKHFNSHLIHDEPHACGMIVHIKILKY